MRRFADVEIQRLAQYLNENFKQEYNGDKTKGAVDVAIYILNQERWRRRNRRQKKVKELLDK